MNRCLLEVDELLNSFVEKYLTFKGLCYRHCNKASHFVNMLMEEDRVVGVYACRDGYVSRVVYFDLKPDVNWFRSFLSHRLGEEAVRVRDIRVATRYGWELGEDASEEIATLLPAAGSAPSIKEVYWTPYPQSEAEKIRGVFLCSNFGKSQPCRGLFTQEVTAQSRLCPSCR